MGDAPPRLVAARMAPRIYPAIYKLVLERIDPERSHELGAAAMRAGSRLPGLDLMPADSALGVEAMGLRFPTPLGVAAGLDKDASWFRALHRAGFGHVEVGTVTAQGQPGNERPRIWRRSEERALINAMGFPNPGAGAVAARLGERDPTRIVGVNIGKTKVVAEDGVREDYIASALELAPLADYLTINVSSPNTPGLRALQDPDLLAGLLDAVRSALGGAGVDRPILIKISPDMDHSQTEEIAELALDRGLAGLIATNTTIDSPLLAEGQPGGVSGRPLKRRSLEVLRRLRAKVGDRLTLVSVGGVEDADDVWKRLAAGASLVQAYTGFVYGGPTWPAALQRALSGASPAGGISSDGGEP